MSELAAVLLQHAIVEVGGGTATGTYWRCKCGATDIDNRRWPLRDQAALAGAAHVAEQVTAWLAEQLAAPEMREVVARALLESDIAAGRAAEWDDGDEIHEWFRENADAAIAAVTAHLCGEA